MTVYLVNILYLVLFLVLYWKDRRRMANGFLFFILLVLSGASLLRLAQDTQSEFLYFVVFEEKIGPKVKFLTHKQT